MTKSKSSFRQQQRQRQFLNWSVTLGSAIWCALLLPLRLPGLELLGIGPHWLLIWVVAWSIKRTALQGAIAGFAVGLIHDGMSAHQPSHILSLTLVGLLVGRIQKEKYIQEDFISIALIVFVMAVIAETVAAMQHSLLDISRLGEIWISHQRIALSSAVLSSLWAPAVYYPLSRWWEWVEALSDH